MSTITLDPRLPATASLPTEKSWCTEIVERVQSIWNAVCACICEWTSWLLSSMLPRKPLIPNRLSLCPPDPLFKISSYLRPEELGRLERVSPAVKRSIDSQAQRIWKRQCELEGVAYVPRSGLYKEAFTYPYPEDAFGPREWEKYFGRPGPIPPLSAKIHRIFAKYPDLKKQFAITALPATLDGKPFSLNLLQERVKAPREGKPVHFQAPICPEIFTKYGDEPVKEACWLFMEQTVPGYTKERPYEEAEKSYLGKTLWIATSIVGSVLHTGKFLLGEQGYTTPDSWVFTHTCDSLEVNKDKGSVAVGGVIYSSDRDYCIVKFVHTKRRSDPYEDVGVAKCMPAEIVLNAYTKLI